jgi:hypothetical protein
MKKMKERKPPRANLKVKVSAMRAMTPEEERRFTAAIDALLSDLVRQELCRQKGGCDEQTKQMGGQPIYLPCPTE